MKIWHAVAGRSPVHTNMLEAYVVKKLQKTNTSKKSPVQLSGSVKDSAQQIWLAGLAAFTKAQNEGGKVFETLAKEGLSIQRKTQAAAEEKITEATSKVADMATGITSKATGQWDKLETIFEERVAKALNKLGVPSSKDIDALIARIDELTRSVQKLSAKPTTGSPAPASKRATARKAPNANPDGAVGAAKAPARRPARKAKPSEA